MYDYIIIGAGPSGLTLAYKLGKIGKKCLLVDRNETVGGCHRVTRVNGLFTEHGPRVYSSTYLNTSKILSEMGTSFQETFVPYLFSISTIQGKSISYFRFKELMILFWEFVKMTFGGVVATAISVKEFADLHNFSEKAKSYLDNVCRLTDGADSSKYPLYKFLQLVNQQFFYNLYQPNKPNDVGLFHIWKNAIIETKNVDFLLSTNVEKIVMNNEKVSSIIGSSLGNIVEFECKNVILCVPPNAMEKILDNSSLNDVFEKDFSKFVQNNSYNQYIPITFHWDTEVKLPDVWGFPESEWGIAFIVLSNYMKFGDVRSKTVISTCVTKPKSISSVIGKTADECNQEEMIAEVFRQLQIAFPDLPSATFSILDPHVYKTDSEWVNTDSAYVETTKQQFLSQSGKISNLYNVGTQNGFSDYEFTSMESAVTNALTFLKKTQTEYSRMEIKSPVTLVYVLRIIAIIIVLWVCFKRIL